MNFMFKLILEAFKTFSKPPTDNKALETVLISVSRSSQLSMGGSANKYPTDSTNLTKHPGKQHARELFRFNWAFLLFMWTNPKLKNLSVKGERK